MLPGRSLSRPATWILTMNGAACSCPGSALRLSLWPGQAGTGTAANDTIREVGCALGGAIVGSLARAQCQPKSHRGPRAGLQ